MIDVVIDPDAIRSMPHYGLWDNYVAAMDMVIMCVKAGNHQEALFYMAVVKVSLDLYFDRVEELVDDYED